MPKKTTRKDLLKSQDEFLSLSARALAFFSAHIRELKIAGIVIVAACVVFLGTTAFYRHINKKGQEAYNTAYSAMAEHLGHGIETEKLEEIHDLFADVVENYSRSKAADLALPQLAFLKFMVGEYDEAIRLYSDFKASAAKKDDFVSLGSLAVAACHEAKGEPDRAIALLEHIAGDRDNRFRETALFTLARLYKLTGDESRAAELAREFIEEFQRSAFIPIAKTYL